MHGGSKKVKFQIKIVKKYFTALARSIHIKKHIKYSHQGAKLDQLQCSKAYFALSWDNFLKVLRRKETTLSITASGISSLFMHNSNKRTSLIEILNLTTRLET